MKASDGAVSNVPVGCGLPGEREGRLELCPEWEEDNPLDLRRHQEFGVYFGMIFMMGYIRGSDSKEQKKVILVLELWLGDEQSHGQLEDFSAKNWPWLPDLICQGRGRKHGPSENTNERCSFLYLDGPDGVM